MTQPANRRLVTEAGLTDALSTVNAWTSLTTGDLNDAPDGVVFLDSGAPPANSPAGGELDGQVATITKIVPFGDPLVDVAWRIQSAECVAFDGTSARSFLREQWQGTWTDWAEIGADESIVRWGQWGLDLQNRSIYNLNPVPVNPQDAVSKAYADSLVAPHYVEAAMPATWTPDLSTFSNAPLVYGNMTDGAAGWDSSAPGWTIPITGVYAVSGSVRPIDGTPAGVQIGVGIGSASTDGPTFAWYATSSALRNSFTQSRTQYFAAGDVVRLFVYVEAGNPVTLQAAAMALTLVAAYPS